VAKDRHRSKVAKRWRRTGIAVAHALLAAASGVLIDVILKRWRRTGIAVAHALLAAASGVLIDVILGQGLAAKPAIPHPSIKSKPLSTHCVSFCPRPRFYTPPIKSKPLSARCVSFCPPSFCPQEPLYDCRAGRIHKIRETEHS
jgi:aryl carrier-like protein